MALFFLMMASFLAQDHKYQRIKAYSSPVRLLLEFLFQLHRKADCRLFPVHPSSPPSYTGSRGLKNLSVFTPNAQKNRLDILYVLLYTGSYRPPPGPSTIERRQNYDAIY